MFAMLLVRVFWLCLIIFLRRLQNRGTTEKSKFDVLDIRLVRRQGGNASHPNSFCSSISGTLHDSEVD